MATTFLYVFLAWFITYNPDGTPEPMHWGLGDSIIAVATCPAAPASCEPEKDATRYSCEFQRQHYGSTLWESEQPGYYGHPAYVVESACRELALPFTPPEQVVRVVGNVTIPPECLHDMASRWVRDFPTFATREPRRKAIKALVRTGQLGSQSFWDWQCKHP
jgi:hypothetical protein